MDAVIRAAAIERAEHVDAVTIFVWATNAPEQIEAALLEAGYELRPNAPRSATGANNEGGKQHE